MNNNVKMLRAIKSLRENLYYIEGLAAKYIYQDPDESHMHHAIRNSRIDLDVLSKIHIADTGRRMQAEVDKIGEEE